MLERVELNEGTMEESILLLSEVVVIEIFFALFEGV
jgi:hypothetical protein